MSNDLLNDWIARIREAALERRPLWLRGSGSKDFYGASPAEAPGIMLDTTAYAGVVDYEPSELVLTARAGTRLADIEALLAESGQMLAFEPPHFGPGATLGGCVAAGLSGPRRASAGAVRDFVLGVRIIDGRGEHLRFGGQVMKNVAGYDVSRLMCGSLGTLGLITEVSLKVLPRPLEERTLRFELPEAEAIDKLNRWGGQPLPISASAWCDGVLNLRLSGARAAVQAAAHKLGGETLAESKAQAFWQQLREQKLTWFALRAGHTLWRLSLPSVAGPLRLGEGGALIEWGGALRWAHVRDAEAEELRQRVSQLGGHATIWRSVRNDLDAFTPLPPALMELHRRLKVAFDPAGIFNPGRLYRGL